MSVEMTSGVLAARAMEGMRFVLGPTMAFRRDVIRRKRHGRRRAQSLERADQHLDFTRRKLGVDCPLGAAHDLAFDRDVELGAHVTGRFMRGSIVHGIEHELHDSVAIAKVDENQAAVIAPGLHPSPQRDLAAHVGGANRAAVVSSLPRRQRRILLSLAHCS